LGAFLVRCVFYRKHPRNSQVLFNSALGPIRARVRCEVNLSSGMAIPTISRESASIIFSPLQTARGMQQTRADEVARNGAL
jgi:hypothetical protein